MRISTPVQLEGKIPDGQMGGKNWSEWEWYCGRGSELPPIVCIAFDFRFLGSGAALPPSLARRSQLCISLDVCMFAQSSGRRVINKVYYNGSGFGFGCGLWLHREKIKLKLVLSSEMFYTCSGNIFYAVLRV